MRRNFALLLTMVLLLAACGGQQTVLPTSAVIDLPTSDPAATSEPTVEGQAAATVTPIGLQASTATPDPGLGAAGATVEFQRFIETDEPPLPQPGSFSTPSTPDPNEGLIFDVILFERTGGPEGEPLTIEVRSDGTVTRDGVASTITPEQVALIDGVLDQVRFFGLQGYFTAPGTSSELYTYRVTVDRAGSSRSIDMQDGLYPQELGQLIALLSSLGAS